MDEEPRRTSREQRFYLEGSAPGVFYKIVHGLFLFREKGGWKTDSEYSAPWRGWYSLICIFNILAPLLSHSGFRKYKPKHSGDIKFYVSNDFIWLFSYILSLNNCNWEEKNSHLNILTLNQFINESRAKCNRGTELKLNSEGFLNIFLQLVKSFIFLLISSLVNYSLNWFQTENNLCDDKSCDFVWKKTSLWYWAVKLAVDTVVPWYVPLVYGIFVFHIRRIMVNFFFSQNGFRRHYWGWEYRVGMCPW